jgi:hypothetical protein
VPTVLLVEQVSNESLRAAQKALIWQREAMFGTEALPRRAIAGRHKSHELVPSISLRPGGAFVNEAASLCLNPLVYVDVVASRVGHQLVLYLTHFL